MDNSLLNDRIARLKEWQQKESLNEILFGALSTLNAYTKERFDDLTQKIVDESALNQEAPVIKVAVCETEDIDKHLFLYPVATDPPLKSMGYLTTIFADCDYYIVSELMRHTFSAKITDKTGTHSVRVALRYSQKYLQKVENLYYVYGENNLPWNTINGVYFYKFLDVYCLKDASGKERENAKITGFEIDFANYNKYISYDKTLLWNIKPQTVAVASCEAQPAYNMVQFEHKIKNLQLDENRYLVKPFDDRFICYRSGPLMHIRTYSKQLDKFELLRISYGEDADSPLCLPIKSNQKKPSLIEALARGRYIPTRGEAERIINSVSEKEDFRLVDIKSLPFSDDGVNQYKGIDYNSFLEANSLLATKKLLLFTFETDSDPLWASEIMFYILSELQLYFYEHRCVGEIL